MMEEQRLPESPNSDSIRRVIQEHPELPIIVLASNDVYQDTDWTLCTTVNAHVGCYLDMVTPFNPDRVYTDITEDEYERDLRNYVAEGTPPSEREDVFTRYQIEYDRYWKKAIILFASF